MSRGVNIEILGRSEHSTTDPQGARPSEEGNERGGCAIGSVVTPLPTCAFQQIDQNGDQGA